MPTDASTPARHLPSGHKWHYSFYGLLGLLAISIAGPWLSPYSPWSHDLQHCLQAPSWQHWLGTDRLGRDNLTCLLHATRISVVTATVATSVSVVIGTSYGMLAGYTRGWAQAALLRGIDLLYALPHLLIVIVLMALCGNNTLSLCISIGLLSWLNMARIVYGQVRYLRSKAYLEAAQALGQSHLGIIFKHLLPNLYHLIIVCATLTVPGVILMESTLSFLGLGLRAPQSSLGEMIRQGCTLMEIYPSALLAPCLVLSTLLVTLTVVGESIESRWRMALEGK